ncbi:hypothetical protein F4561_000590 [Lipingzhangella halophila]|uniref:Uncharacterized protein n=1 Tax=Lipingzhangella halophila TaxID=1783352 RepID=A0A7W7RD13_9ACTN|nr:hypothetical protein [Lipingzhangella halophila]MBB4929770.1 hypothetical protein [Lipingzhangella halophila]
MSPTLVLADSQIPPETVTPGVLGFIVVALIGFVLYFLMKSMLGKLQTVRGKEFGEDKAAGAEPGESAGPPDPGVTTEERESNGSS